MGAESASGKMGSGTPTYVSGLATLHGLADRMAERYNHQMGHSGGDIRLLHGVVRRRLHSRQAAIKEGPAATGISPGKPPPDVYTACAGGAMVLTDVCSSSCRTLNANATARPASPRTTSPSTRRSLDTTPTRRTSNGKTRRGRSLRPCTTTTTHRRSTLHRRAPPRRIRARAGRPWRCPCTLRRKGPSKAAWWAARGTLSKEGCKGRHKRYRRGHRQPRRRSWACWIDFDGRAVGGSGQKERKGREARVM